MAALGMTLSELNKAKLHPYVCYIYFNPVISEKTETSPNVK